MSRRMRAQCYCAAYPFPHRASGGKCRADADEPQQLCAACRLPCQPITADFGIGAYEYWGCRGVHRDVRTVSDCCDDGLIDNTASGDGMSHSRPFKFPTTTGVNA